MEGADRVDNAVVADIDVAFATGGQLLGQCNDMHIVSLSPSYVTDYSDECGLQDGAIRNVHSIESNALGMNATSHRMADKRSALFKVAPRQL
jgi:hypothetical protein